MRVLLVQKSTYLRKKKSKYQTLKKKQTDFTDFVGEKNTFNLGEGPDVATSEQQCKGTIKNYFFY